MGKASAEKLQQVLDQRKSDRQYEPIDAYLKDLKEADFDPLTLARHLAGQQKELKMFRETDGGSGPVRKAIAVIESLIEAKGGDVEALLKQIREEPEPPESPTDDYIADLMHKNE